MRAPQILSFNGAPHMAPTAFPNLLGVDWSKIPAPKDDGGARHLEGMRIPYVALTATDATQVELARLPGRVVVFAYPRTGQPGAPSLVDDWDMIPGARGCTPQTCAFRDLYKTMIGVGVARVFGLSTQDSVYQREAAERLHLPFPLLSDEKLALTHALRLPTMSVADMTLIKRLAMIIDDGVIKKVFYPVFPPDRNAPDVLAWLEAHRPA
jgi:peroxiredoxin